MATTDGEGVSIEPEPLGTIRIDGFSTGRGDLQQNLRGQTGHALLARSKAKPDPLANIDVANLSATERDKILRKQSKDKGYTTKPVFLKLDCIVALAAPPGIPQATVRINSHLKGLHMTETTHDHLFTQEALDERHDPERLYVADVYHTEGITRKSSWRKALRCAGSEMINDCASPDDEPGYPEFVYARWTKLDTLAQAGRKESPDLDVFRYLQWNRKPKTAIARKEVDRLYRQLPHAIICSRNRLEKLIRLLVTPDEHYINLGMIPISSVKTSEDEDMKEQGKAEKEIFKADEKKEKNRYRRRDQRPDHRKEIFVPLPQEESCRVQIELVDQSAHSAHLRLSYTFRSVDKSGRTQPVDRAYNTYFYENTKLPGTGFDLINHHITLADVTSASHHKRLLQLFPLHTSSYINELRDTCEGDRLYLIRIPYNGKPWAANIYGTGPPVAKEHDLLRICSRQPGIQWVLTRTDHLESLMGRLNIALKDLRDDNPHRYYFVDSDNLRVGPKEVLVPSERPYKGMRVVPEITIPTWDHYRVIEGLANYFEHEFNASAEAPYSGKATFFPPPAVKHTVVGDVPKSGYIMFTLDETHQNRPKLTEGTQLSISWETFKDNETVLPVGKREWKGFVTPGLPISGLGTVTILAFRGCEMNRQTGVWVYDDITLKDCTVPARISALDTRTAREVAGQVFKRDVVLWPKVDRKTAKNEENGLMRFLPGKDKDDRVKTKLAVFRELFLGNDLQSLPISGAFDRVPRGKKRELLEIFRNTMNIDQKEAFATLESRLYADTAIIRGIGGGGKTHIALCAAFLLLCGNIWKDVPILDTTDSDDNAPSNEPKDESVKGGDSPSDKPKDESVKGGDSPSDKPKDESAKGDDDSPSDKPKDESVKGGDDSPSDKPKDESAKGDDDSPSDKPKDESVKSSGDQPSHASPTFGEPAKYAEGNGLYDDPPPATWFSHKLPPSHTSRSLTVANPADFDDDVHAASDHSSALEDDRCIRQYDGTADEAPRGTSGGQRLRRAKRRQRKNKGQQASSSLSVDETQVAKDDTVVEEAPFLPVLPEDGDVVGDSAAADTGGDWGNDASGFSTNDAAAPGDSATADTGGDWGNAAPDTAWNDPAVGEEAAAAAADVEDYDDERPHFAPKDGHYLELQRPNVLIVAPLNSHVDKFYERAASMRNSLENQGLLEPPTFIFRCHSKQTECQAVVAIANEAQFNRGPALTNLLDPEDVISDKLLEPTAFLIQQQFIRDTQGNHYEVLDRRFNEAVGSIATLMCQIAGLVRRSQAFQDRFDEEQRTAWSDEFEILRRYQSRINRFESLDPEEQKTRKSKMNSLWSTALGNTDVLLTTIANASDHSVHANFQPDMMIIEEASRVKEGEMWALYSHYSECSARILVGDIDQLPPIVFSSPQNNPYVGHVRQSFMSRLVTAGFESPQLLITERFGDWLPIRLINHLYGNNHVVPSPFTDEKVRKVHQFKQYVTAKYFKSSSIIMLNVEDANVSHIGTSKVNKICAGLAVEIIRDMIEAGFRGEEIGYCTSYREQLSLVQRIMEDTRKPQSIGITQEIAKIQYGTTETFQGDQRLFMIFDPVSSDTLGFNDIDERPFTMALRMQCGGIWLGNVSEILRIKFKQRCLLPQIIRFLKNEGLVVDIGRNSWKRGGLNGVLKSMGLQAANVEEDIDITLPSRKENEFDASGPPNGDWDDTSASIMQDWSTVALSVDDYPATSQSDGTLAQSAVVGKGGDVSDAAAEVTWDTVDSKWDTTAMAADDEWETGENWAGAQAESNWAGEQEENNWAGTETEEYWAGAGQVDLTNLEQNLNSLEGLYADYYTSEQLEFALLQCGNNLEATMDALHHLQELDEYKQIPVVEWVNNNMEKAPADRSKPPKEIKPFVKKSDDPREQPCRMM